MSFYLIDSDYAMSAGGSGVFGPLIRAERTVELVKSTRLESSQFESIRVNS